MAAWVETVTDHLPAGPSRSLVSELAVEPLKLLRSGEVDERYAGGIIARMAERVAAADERRLRSALQRAEAAGDRGEAQELTVRLSGAALHRRALAERANEV